MKPKKNIFLAMIFLSLFWGCGEAPLVEVTVEKVWKIDDYLKYDSMKSPYPHIIATRQDTGERVCILGDTWGDVGETFLISENKILQ